MDYQKLKKIHKSASEGFGARIAAELEYALEVSRLHGGAFDGLISEVTDRLYGQFAENGAVSREMCLGAEQALAPVSPAAKSLTVLCVAHAHIDMNWMWGYDETACITLSTFRTMLDLMKEYPDFKFSQSQASVYKITEELDPEMLEEIRLRVREGRWEVSASTWVEGDKNLPNGEGLLRQHLYAKQYLSGLFGLDPDSLNLDFEPDTFGHSLNLPEILSAAGVRYYYHCRGNQKPAIYRWKAPSGKSVLVFREPTSYNWKITPFDFRNVPSFAGEFGLKKVLRVYGIGDHGGGATRRDLERLKDMQTWPVMPTIEFSTYREFFDSLEQSGSSFPEVEGEQNYVFPGCYTSQSRIKEANRKGESAFKQTEMLAALTAAAGLTAYDAEGMRRAWQSHLFNHFHDILPGSGKRETREYALGMAQRVFARCGAEKTKALKALGAQIDTAEWVEPDNESALAGGGGGGYYTGKWVFSASTGVGRTRLFLVTNATALSGKFLVQLTLFDYAEDLDNLEVRDGSGKILPSEVLDKTPLDYWQHEYVRVNVLCELPAYGYSTLICRCTKNERPPIVYGPVFERQFRPETFVLENDQVRAVFDPDNASLTSLLDKETGTEYAGTPLSVFEFLTEDACKGMSAWTVGRYFKREKIDGGVSIRQQAYRPDGLQKTLAYEADFGRSRLCVTITLDEGSKWLDFDVTCDFREFGEFLKTTPQLAFTTETGEGCEYVYDVPLGLIRREDRDEDQAANSFVFAQRGQEGLIVTSDSKHGFRCHGGKVLLDLIRASADPDPYPENYRHHFHIGLAPYRCTDPKSLIDFAESFSLKPDLLTLKPGRGNLPRSAALIELSGGCNLLAVKPGEDGSGVVLRLCNPAPAAVRQEVAMLFPIRKACLADLFERPLEELAVKDGRVTLEVPAGSVRTVKVWTGRRF